MMMATMKTMINEFESRKNDRTYNRNSWKVPGLDGAKFLELFRYFGDYYCDIKSPGTKFITDDNNRELITQLFFYIKGDQDKCSFNIYRGIYLSGAIGCGKTILMNTFLSVQDQLTRHRITRIQAKSISDLIIANGVHQYNECPMFIDDVGRENLEDIDYGKRIRPFTDLISQRYESGSFTFATSNYSIKTLEGTNDRPGYGPYITTRMQEMFNFVELRGKNRRKVINYGAK